MRLGIGARRMTLSCCMVLVAAGGTTHTAEATPQPSADPLPPGLVAAVRHDLGIDPGEYLERSGTAQRLAEFADSARRAYPAVYAGARMDGARPVVSLVAGEPAEPARQAAEQAGFAVETVAESEAALRDRGAAFERWLSQQSDSVTESIVGYGIDVAGDSLAVNVSKQVTFPPEMGHVRSVPTMLPEALPDKTPTTAQAIADAGPTDDIVGGEPYVIDVAGSLHKCSFGFNATDADGHAVNITAGHCDPNNLVAADAKTTGPRRVIDSADPRHARELGHFEFSDLGPHDYSIVRIADDAAPRFRNNLVSTHRLPTAKAPTGSSGTGSGASQAAGSSGTGSGAPQATGRDGTQATADPASPDEVLRIDGTAEPVAGAPVCKSGFKSGYTCGTVIAVGQKGLLRGVPGHDKQVITVDGMFFTDVCAQRGDSGGPIFTGTKALGVSSAIVTFSTPLDQGCGHLPVLIGQPIGTALRDHPGLTIRTD